MAKSEAQFEISALGHRGEGVADFNGKRIFVPLTVPGDKISARLDGQRCELLEVLEAGPDRIDPFCPHFGGCGGCQLQHLSNPAYQTFKISLAERAFQFAGINLEIAGLVDAGGDGRRRATLSVKNARAGYHALRTHFIHEFDRCPILVPQLDPAQKIAKQLGKLTGDAGISFTSTATGLDVSVKPEKRGKKRPDFRALGAVAVEHDLARLTLDGEDVLVARPPMVRIGAANVTLPSGAFLQATQKAEEVLAEQVLEGAGDAKRIADLFSGIGTFALRLAANGKTFFADSDKKAIAACEAAMRATPGLHPIGGAVRNLFNDPLTADEVKPFDCIVIDPPRAGAKAQIEEIANSTVNKVVSVSCDPQSFARDAATLIEAGFKPGPVTLVDQFRYAAHIELVCTFTR